MSWTSSALLIACLSLGTISQAQTPQLVHQFTPVNWIENIAVLANGDILPIVTLGTSAVLNKLDPVTNAIEEVYDFSSAGNAIQGITAVERNVFVLHVVTCNLTALSCTPGSASSWSVDFRQRGSEQDDGKALVTQLVSWPEAEFLNGMVALNRHAVLVADSFLGGIWKLNLKTKTKELLFTDPSMVGNSRSPTGVNGIRLFEDKLYFTNSAAGTFNVVSIDRNTGMKLSGNATVIASGLSGPDDFEIDGRKGVAYLANGVANQVLQIDLHNGTSSVIASLPGPTSLRWSGPRGKRKLYASTCGGLLQYSSHNITLGGAVYKIEV